MTKTADTLVFLGAVLAFDADVGAVGAMLTVGAVDCRGSVLGLLEMFKSRDGKVGSVADLSRVMLLATVAVAAGFICNDWPLRKTR